MTGRVKGVAQIAALACVAGLLGLLVWKLTHQNHAPPVGAAAPAFTLPRLDGSGSVSLASLRGHPVVLNFWASWCEPCREEAPIFAEELHRHAAQGLRVVGVNSQDFLSDARKFAATYHVRYPLVHDGSNDVTTRWGVSGFPATFVIGRDGTVRWFQNQEITAQELDQAITPILGTGPA